MCVCVCVCVCVCSYVCVCVCVCVCVREKERERERERERSKTRETNNYIGYTSTTCCVFTLYILPGPIPQQSDKFATEVMMLESQLDSADKSNK